PDSSQRLLDEALGEQRAEKKRQVEGFLKDSKRFEQIEPGWQFSLSRGEVEWLLQILNDVRLGSWILLGSPDENLRIEQVTEQIAPYFWSMEMAGHFQMELLSALNC